MKKTAEQCYDEMVEYCRFGMSSDDFSSPKWFYKKFGGELLQTSGEVMLAIKIFSDKKVLSISSDVYVIAKWTGKNTPTVEEVYDALDFEGKLEVVKRFYF